MAIISKYAVCGGIFTDRVVSSTDGFLRVFSVLNPCSDAETKGKG
jgi:hypothetical protein